MNSREFPGGLQVKIPGFHCRGPGSIPGWGIEIPQATWHGQKTNKQISKQTKTEFHFGKKVLAKSCNPNTADEQKYIALIPENIELRSQNT